MVVTVANDDQLIDETLNKHNSAAFGQLVLKYQDRLFHCVRHILGNSTDAEDVVQDAMVQAMVKLKTFERNSSFFTWLYRIAVNMALSHRRRKKAKISLDDMHQQSGREPIDGRASPEAPLHAKESVLQVRKALAEMDEDHRVVLVLREMDALSYDEIAEILDLPIGTVRSRLHRARLELRGILKKSIRET